MTWIDLLKERNEIVHIAVTGAGASLARDIWITPGASEWFSGFSFPYSREETIEFIGYEPEKFCSKETALEMAMVAYMKAYTFGSKKKPVGIGLCASVATNRDKKGHDRCHVAVVTDDKIVAVTRFLEPRNRDDQDWGCSFYARNTYCAVHDDASEIALELLLKRPLFNNRKRITPGATAQMCDRAYCVYPGAFNPVHEGHAQSALFAELVTARKCVLNIELDAPNKPSLSVQECLKRLALLRDQSVIVTKGHPLYLDKAKFFPDTPFVIGSDALQRMLDPKWGPEVIPMLYEFSQLGTTFLVAPRVENGKALTLDEVLKNVTGINPELTSMFIELPPVIEMSSTAIRQEAVV